MTARRVLPPSTRPRVLANFALTLDGKVSTRNRTPSLFTSARDKQRLLEIRALGDALLVGRGTVEADTMSMGLADETLRRERLARGQAEFPLRVIVSKSGNVAPSLKVFHSPGGGVLFFTGNEINEALKESLHALPQVQVLVMEELSISAVLQMLKENLRVESVVCEGGPTLLRSLFDIDALDEIYLTIAPRIFGGTDAPTLTGSGLDFLENPGLFHLEGVALEGEEVFTHYKRER